MQQQQIVSDPSEQLILVDSDDRDIGTMSKMDCHVGSGVLHRAFSIFLFNSDGEVLMQKRSAEKPLWPLYWSNSCCSHPRYGESMELAVQRRMQDELGVQCPLTFLYKFEYQASFEDVGAEHEVCSVYRGQYDGPINANETEIADLRFFTPAEVDDKIEIEPDVFTPWFKLEWSRIMQDFPAPGGSAAAPPVAKE